MSKCWYCNNELTTADNPKHFGICNKCYDKMFKSGDTIIRSFTNKIAELQKQLEESEEEHELLINDFEKETENLRKQIKQESDARERFVKKVEELKQQLEDAEEHIDNLELQLREQYQIVDEKDEQLAEQYAEVEKVEQHYLKQREYYTKEFNEVIDNLKQQLAKKEKMLERIMSGEYIPATIAEKSIKLHNQDKISFAVDVLKIAQDYVQQYVNDFDDKNDCLCAIDNQIKRLTHQHEDKGE